MTFAALQCLRSIKKLRLYSRLHKSQFMCMEEMQNKDCEILAFGSSQRLVAAMLVPSTLEGGCLGRGV